MQASAKTIAHLGPGETGTSFFRLAEPYVQQLQQVPVFALAIALLFL